MHRMGGHRKWKHEAQAFLKMLSVRGGSSEASSNFDLALPNPTNTITVPCTMARLRTKQDVVSAMTQISQILKKVAAQGGLTVVAWTLGMSPLGGIPVTSADMLNHYLQSNTWARINFDVFRYYSPSWRMKQKAEAFVHEHMPEGFIAVHIRISDECAKCLGSTLGRKCHAKSTYQKSYPAHKAWGMDVCFAPGGKQFAEERFWGRLQALAARNNVSHIYVAAPHGIEMLANASLWPENAVTMSKSMRSLVDDFDLSMVEQAICTKAHTFIYTATSRLGRKSISRSGKVDTESHLWESNRKDNGASHGDKMAESTPILARLPPNTSTWAIVVLLHRLVQMGMSVPNVAIESLMASFPDA